MDSADDDHDGPAVPPAPEPAVGPREGAAHFHGLRAFLVRRALALGRHHQGHLRSVGRMILLAGLVGVVAGLGAVLFQYLSHVIAHYGLEWLAGYHARGPAAEGTYLGEAAPLLGEFSPWLLLAVLTAGGLVSGALVFLIAPEAEGHGTDAAIRAYHRGRGIIRARVPLVKIVASAVTLGTGGSGGREGPIAQIGAGFGSLLAVRLRLSEYERRLLLAAGLGAGVAAIFRAPLAGAIFATEVLYREADFEAEALIPAFISCTTAYCVFGMVLKLLGIGNGFEHLFFIHPVHFDDPMLLLPLAALAVLMAGAARLYVGVFYGVNAWFKELKAPAWTRPAVGALVSGLLAVVLYYAASWLGAGAQHQTLNVLSIGYGVLQDIMYGDLPGRALVAAALLAAIGLGKLVTTSFTIGSGGSGGVFGPSMVIGGTLGAAVGLVFHAWIPSTVTRIDVFALLGMAAFFSAAAKTPVSTIIIVSELTGGYELLLPAMWVAAIAYLLSGGRWSIYHEQVATRIDSPAHRPDFIVDVLRGLTIERSGIKPQTDIVSVPQNMPFHEIIDLIPRTVQTVFPVVDAEGRFCGLFGLADVRRFLAQHGTNRIIIAGDVMAEDVEPIRKDADLSEIMARFARVKYEELPLVEAESRRVIGMIRRQDIIAVYDARLTAHPAQPTEEEM
jgi:CIC family chloride channel protein